MTITIDLAPEVLSRLHDKAAREGQETEAVAARLLAEAPFAPRLRDEVFPPTFFIGTSWPVLDALG